MVLSKAESVHRSFVDAIASTEEEVDEILYRENARQIDARARMRVKTW